MKIDKKLKWGGTVSLVAALFAFSPSGDDSDFTTVTFKSTNNVTVTADVYPSASHDKDTSPIILLFHQARFSRGEYREIAPKLAQMGYTCMAIDQRSGDAVNGVVNQTHLIADKLDLPTEYVDAYPDLDAAIQYAKKQFPNRKLILWGSSYSSSLSFIFGANYPDEVAGVLAFSPGEYFTYHENSIENYAREVKCPVFITSAKNEHDKWVAIYAAVPNAKKLSYLPAGEGFHGSKALWEENKGHKEYWNAVTKFLASLK